MWTRYVKHDVVYKTQVCDVSQRRQKVTDFEITVPKKLMKCSRVYASGQETDRKTETCIALLRTAPGGKVLIVVIT